MCFDGVLVRVRTRLQAHGRSRTTLRRDIYEIPTSSPAHNVTYVTVEDSDQDDGGPCR